MGIKHRLSSVNKLLEVKRNRVVLKQSESNSEKLLGCVIQSELKWGNHVAMLCSKLKKRLAALRCLRYSCPFTVRRRVAEGIFNSVLSYCLPLFGGMQKSQMNEIQVLQSQAARLTCNAAPRTKCKDLFSTSWVADCQTIDKLSYTHCYFQY